MIVLFAVYVWVMTSGHERFVIEQGKAIYNSLLAWFDDAEVDYQVKKKDQPSKKHRRRWD